MATEDIRPTVIIAGPPTANGDLHIGHVAGPYVGGDVYARYLRAVGRPVVWASCTDDSQTYVVTTAKRLGTTPTELVARSTELIRTTFEAMGIALDGFSPTDDGYRAMVYDYLGRLHDAGKFRLRTVRLPYGERSGKFLVEGFIGGTCPTCLDDSRGGFCETCGHPIDVDGLIEPYSILDPGEPVTYREAQILVLPMEEYRERLIAYHAERADRWRPHVVTLMREVLAKPLPDYPITYPVDWGLPAPWPETPGQTINAWLEGMPASIYCTGWARRHSAGSPAAATDDAWRAEHDARTIVFMGFDPLYVWGLVHIAELMAHEGRYVLTDTLHINEFYELDHDKFSTSKGHVVWARDLVAEVPRDVVRFYLCVSAPEYARTNFSRSTLDKIAGERLVAPWNEWAASLAKLAAEVGAQEPLPVPVTTPAYAAAIVRRFASCYELDSFSLARAADLIVQHTARLRSLAAQTLTDGLDRDAIRQRAGDLFLQARALISGASPILIDLAERADVSISFDPDAYQVTHTTVLAVPTLTLRMAPERSHSDI